MKSPAEWRQLGFIEQPKSQKQGDLALDARRFIESRRCFTSLKMFISMGHPPSHLLGYLRLQEETDGLSADTLKKYCQIYRRFFVTPLEVLRASAGEEETAIIRRKVSQIGDRQAEISRLESAAIAQWGRIQKLMTFEDGLGYALPDLDKQFDVHRKLEAELLEKKMDLGIYARVPYRMAVAAAVKTTYGFNDLTSDERAALKEFGEMVFEMIEHTKNAATMAGYSPPLLSNGKGDPN